MCDRPISGLFAVGHIGLETNEQSDDKTGSVERSGYLIICYDRLKADKI